MTKLSEEIVISFIKEIAAEYDCEYLVDNIHNIKITMGGGTVITMSHSNVMTNTICVDEDGHGVTLEKELKKKLILNGYKYNIKVIQDPVYDMGEEYNKIGKMVNVNASSLRPGMVIYYRHRIWAINSVEEYIDEFYDRARPSFVNIQMNYICNTDRVLNLDVKYDKKFNMVKGMSVTYEEAS